MAKMTTADVSKEIRDLDLAVRDALLAGDIEQKMKDLHSRFVSTQLDLFL